MTAGAAANDTAGPLVLLLPPGTTKTVKGTHDRTAKKLEGSGCASVMTVSFAFALLLLLVLPLAAASEGAS
jgi:hypothetical protein